MHDYYYALEGSRMGHSVKVSLWCVALALDFAFLFKISNC